jgi:hypothetical protein
VAYKPKFPQQAYKPKFKNNELIAIARKMSSTDWYKSTLDPVEFEWHPKKGYVKLHFQYNFDNGAGISEQDTWVLHYPIEPFEMGYDNWIKKIRGIEDEKDSGASSTK